MSDDTIKSIPAKLYHEMRDSDDVFFSRIDAYGGWPVGKKYVMFYHAGERIRPCEFGDNYVRNGWWTTTHSADDYYLWKLSAGAKEKLLQSLRVRVMDRLVGMLNSAALAEVAL